MLQSNAALRGENGDGDKVEDGRDKFRKREDERRVRMCMNRFLSGLGGLFSCHSGGEAVRGRVYTLKTMKSGCASQKCLFYLIILFMWTMAIIACCCCCCCSWA